jgi:hypothetical protein
MEIQSARPPETNEGNSRTLTATVARETFSCTLPHRRQEWPGRAVDVSDSALLNFDQLKP